MTKKTLTLAILSALCAAPLLAVAQHAMGPGRGHGAERFARLDANHDGSISADEMKAEVARRFAQFDQNHDGVVDKAEVDAQAKQRFERMDTDHNGVLSVDELSRHHGQGGEGWQHGGHDGSVHGEHD